MKGLKIEAATTKIKYGKSGLDTFFAMLLDTPKNIGWMIVAITSS